METALIAFGGVVLGWVLGAATQLLRDRRQAQIALMLIHNELIGNIAQLDLAQNAGVDEDDRVHLSHWARRWRLSRSAWDQQGAMALTRLDADAAWKVQDAYHALDAAELLLEAAREGVIALRGADLPAPENADAVARLATTDAESREKLGVQLRALFEAEEALNRALPSRRRVARGA
jgi:hypothetical protein